MQSTYYFGLIVCTFLKIHGCPFIITNDSKQPVFITDPHSKFAVYIEPGKVKTINPEVEGLKKYFYNEQLNIYVPHGQAGDFYQRYQIGKHICKEEGNKLTFTEIEKLVDDPKNPFSIKRFEFEKKKATHNHSHGSEPHSH
jgi:hypothetical protein